MPDNFDVVDERFRSFVLPNAALETLGEGFGWLEGPVWFADQQSLLFSDIPNNRVMRWTRSGGISVFRDPSDFENGHYRDPQGRLVSCSHHGRITRTELDGRVRVLADRFDGKRLNSPNDLVVKSDGTIWFSDPPYGINTDYEGGKRAPELPANLYRLDPRDGSLTVVADDFQGPNGLAFSPDESLLYIVDTGATHVEDGPREIRVFEVSKDGKSLGNGRHFAKCPVGLYDGLRVDTNGNVWTSTGEGVYCYAPDGTLLGKIKVPEVVANVCFGGPKRNRLYICGTTSLYVTYVNAHGATWPKA